MDLDVSYVRYPGLWHVWWEEVKCALGQSVVKLAVQLLALMDKTADKQKLFILVHTCRALHILVHIHNYTQLAIHKCTHI